LLNRIVLQEAYPKQEKIFKLRKSPDILTEGGVFCKENESFLVSHLSHFYQTSLVLDNFPLNSAHPGTLALLL